MLNRFIRFIFPDSHFVSSETSPEICFTVGWKRHVSLPVVLSLSLSLLSSHSPCLIRSVISPHSGWCLLIWQHYCLPVRCCCLYCLLSHLTNSSKEKEREWEKIAANHAVSHNWLCKSGGASLCLQMVHEMCVCLCNFSHLSFVLLLTRWDGALSHCYVSLYVYLGSCLFYVCTSVSLYMCIFLLWLFIYFCMCPCQLYVKICSFIFAVEGKYSSVL